MIKCTIWKIKKGKRKIWEDWCKELMGKYHKEALETLIEEDLIAEHCIIFGKGDNSFVRYIHETVPNKEKKPMNPNREINQKHNRIFKECLESISFKIGYELYNK